MITKLKFRLELATTYLKKNLIYLTLLIITITLGIIFHRQLINFYNTPKFHSHIIGIQGLYTFNNLPDNIITKISYGLTINSEDDRPVLSPLVKSYQIENNNLDYIFQLNSKIFWQNAKKITAYDINYKIEGLTLTPLSNTSLKISVQNPFTPLLSLLSQPLFKNKIGLGDYQIKKITYQDGFVDSLKLIPKSKQNNTLIYRFYTNDQDIVNAYKMGLVDEIQTDNLPSDLITWNNTKITKAIDTTQKYTAIFLNTSLINNKQIRQALAYATPKTTNKDERCFGPIAPNSWAYNPDIKPYDYDPVRAKQLYGEENLGSINLIVTDRKLLSIAENIKNSWENILNLKTTITVEGQINPDKFQAVLSYGSIPHDPDQYLFWHSTQTKTNITKFNNSRIDKLLEEGRQTFDLQERKKIYQDFQKYLLEESPAIFLSFPTTYTIDRVK